MGDERGKVNHGWSPTTREKEKISRLFKKKKKAFCPFESARGQGTQTYLPIFPQPDYLFGVCVCEYGK